MIDGISPQQPLQNIEALQKQIQINQQPGATEGAESFEDLLSQLIQDVDQAQKVADDSIKSLATGGQEELHEVVLKLEEADMTFKLMQEIRSKLVQAYKEIISMQQ
tara:strand:- start:270 stop:587 length:318 start_codon:yes stop_codon:yes gene_type:complete